MGWRRRAVEEKYPAITPFRIQCVPSHLAHPPENFPSVIEEVSSQSCGSFLALGAGTGFAFLQLLCLEKDDATGHLPRSTAVIGAEVYAASVLAGLQSALILCYRGQRKRLIRSCFVTAFKID